MHFYSCIFRASSSLCPLENSSHCHGSSVLARNASSVWSVTWLVPDLLAKCRLAVCFADLLCILASSRVDQWMAWRLTVGEVSNGALSEEEWRSVRCVNSYTILIYCHAKIWTYLLRRLALFCGDFSFPRSLWRSPLRVTTSGRPIRLCLVCYYI